MAEDIRIHILKQNWEANHKGYISAISNCW